MRENEFIEIDFILSLLKSNNQKIFHEIILAKENKMWATIIVFSLAILDNIFNDEEYLSIIDSLEMNKLKFGKDISWLRNKRNQLLHFQDLNNQSAFIITDDDLKKNSNKAYKILMTSLLKLFPSRNM